MTLLSIDVETRSAVDLKKTGVEPYASDASTDVWCAAYAIGDGPVDIWKMGAPVPPAIVEHVEAGGLLSAWNCNFEIAIWTHILGPRYGWPVPDLEQWRCSMAAAFAMSLPGSLENAAGAIGLDIGKDMAGRRLMMKMAKPRRPRKGEPDGLYWWDSDDEKERLYAYCKNDVVVERAIRKRLVSLSQSEQDLWFLDQRINKRGVMVDVELCRNARAIVRHVTDGLNREMAEVTDHAVTACSNVSQLKTFVRKRGHETESLDKEHLAELLTKKLQPDVRRALELRQEASKASVAKIDALLNAIGADGRVTNLLQFHAANTGRWGGRRFQPQNIRRPSKETDVDAAVEIILREPTKRAAETLELLYGPPITVVSDCLRAMIKAPPGKRLISADYSNIEGRVLAWLARERTKIQAFEDYDAGEGHDVYKITAGNLLGKAPGDIDGEERQALGKVPELASGFRGGHGAYIKMGATGETLRQIVKVTKAQTPTDRWASAAARFDARKGLTKDEWTALRVVIDGWRDRHPATVQYWRDLEDAAFRAVSNPGEIVSVGSIKYRVVGSFLWCQLPSGRALCYCYPTVRWKEMPWPGDKSEWQAFDGDEDAAREAHGSMFRQFDPLTGMALVARPAMKRVVSYKGVDPDTNKWKTLYTYGGKLAENVTQAVARDVMADAMKRLEAVGYPVVLTVHDEIVAEVDEDFGGVEEFTEIMTELPDWARGLPVAAAGWIGERYRK